MTKKEKAEAYDNAIEKVNKIFSELKENEDEKIRTAILNHLKKMWGNCQDDVSGVHVEDAIAWLKTQGEQSKNDMFFTEEEKQKLFDGIFNLFADIKENGCKLNNEMNNETKTLEKLVKPKFKVGDKIFNKPRKYMGASGTQGTILEITKDNYYVFTDGSYVSIDNQDSWELLTDKKPKFDPKTLKPFDKVLVYDIYDICEGWACALFSHIRESEYPYSTSSGSFKVCIPYNDDTKHLLGTTDEVPEYYRYWED